MISVCIATYNGEKYIKEQLDSILLQLGETDEIVISDDNSTDKTIEIISNYNDHRIKIFQHTKNEKLKTMTAAPFRLAANNFENAIKNAQGDFIYLSDQDDIWHPDRIIRTQAYLEKYDLTMCNYKVINNEGHVLDEKFFKKNPVSKILLKNILTIPFRGCCMSFRREILDYCIPLPKACIGHDYWIGYMVTHLGSFKYIDETLHLYRKHYNNVSFERGKSKNSLWFKISYRIKLMCQIILYATKYRLRKICN